MLANPYLCFRTMFRCDTSPASASFCATFHESALWYDDVGGEDFQADAPYVDLLTGGFPCQPWSVAGAQGGFEDARGCVICHIHKYVESRKPKIFILENVKGFVLNFPKELVQVLEAFEAN